MFCGTLGFRGTPVEEYCAKLKNRALSIIVRLEVYLFVLCVILQTNHLTWLNETVFCGGSRCGGSDGTSGSTPAELSTVKRRPFASSLLSSGLTSNKPSMRLRNRMAACVVVVVVAVVVVISVQKGPTYPWAHTHR